MIVAMSPPAEPAPAVAPMPPSSVIDDFLDAGTHRALLDYTLANVERFQPATVYRPGGMRVDTDARDNLKLSDLGPLKEPVGERMLAALPGLASALGCSFPPGAMLELELTAYGDGAFYRAHTDTGLPGAVDPDRKVERDPRLLSAVYYFHRQPKAFDGGALRLFRWGDCDVADPANYRDFEPADNRLVTFLSWSRHEVRPVACPSRRFEDYRFAINCWFRALLPA